MVYLERYYTVLPKSTVGAAASVTDRSIDTLRDHLLTADPKDWQNNEVVLGRIITDLNAVSKYLKEGIVCEAPVVLLAEHFGAAD